MKQFIKLFLCCILAFSLCACAKPDEDSTEPASFSPELPSPESDALNAYIAVLTGKSDFTDVDSGTTLTVDPETCSITDPWNSTTTPKRFTLLDLDGNNASELILWMKDGPDDCAGFWLLWHQDGSVWGQNLTYRCFEQLKWDGTFHNSGDFSQDGTTDGIARMHLTPDGWYSEYIASHTVQIDSDFNIVRENWEVNGQEAASSDFTDIYMKQTDKPTAVWYLFNKTNLAEFGIILDDAEPLPATSAQIQSAFTKVLTDNGAFYDRSAQKESTIQDYCQEATSRIGWPVEIVQTASVDMDGDGVREVILNISVNSNVDIAVWVLHYQNREIQGQLYYHRQLGDIKTDGTFWWSGSASNSGSARLVFDADQWRYEDAPAEGFDEKENIRWADFPGIEPLETVEHTEPWTLFETVFMPFARGEISRITEDYTAYLDRLGYAWTEDEGIISVKDPERPGCYLSGSLGGNEIATLWYSYIIQDHPLSIDQQIQRGVKVKFSDGLPRYFTQVTFWDDGTEVAAPEELDRYMTYPGLRPEETPEGYYRKKMTAVLTDTEDFLSNDRRDPEYGSVNINLSTYLDVLTQEAEKDLTFTKIAVVDIDNDEFPEVALTVAPTDSPENSCYILILRYQEQAVFGQCFAPYEIHGLKADGSFCWYGKHGSSGAAYLDTSDRIWCRREIATEEKKDYSSPDNTMIRHADRAAYSLDDTLSDEEAYRQAMEIQEAKEDVFWVEFEMK